MKLFIKETGDEKTITLKPWNGDQWGCDCFQDMETSVSDGSEVTAAEYQEIVEYWEREVNDFNEGAFSEQFGDPEESCVKEYGFWFD